MFATVPSDWVEPKFEQRLVPDGWGGWTTQQVHSVRVPRDAARDFAVASRVLADGRLIQVARSTDSRAVLLAPLRADFAGVGAVALVLSLSAGTFLAWRATRPLREVANTARRILEEHDLSARIPAPRGSGELAVLARQLNTLLDKNSKHIRVLRETLDDLAHDLRTPLTRLRGTAELALRDGGNPAEARSALADCVEETDRVQHLLEVLLDVSAAEAGALSLRRQRVDLCALAARAADLYREVAEQKNIAIKLDLPEREGNGRRPRPHRPGGLQPRRQRAQVHAGRGPRHALRGKGARGDDAHGDGQRPGRADCRTGGGLAQALPGRLEPVAAGIRPWAPLGSRGGRGPRGNRDRRATPLAAARGSSCGFRRPDRSPGSGGVGLDKRADWRQQWGILGVETPAVRSPRAGTPSL